VIEPYWQDSHRAIYCKDCRDMSELPDGSVQCVPTSPPYWGLRKYSGENYGLGEDNIANLPYGEIDKVI